MLITCFDTETTGIHNSPDKTKDAARIVQIAAKMFEVSSIDSYPHRYEVHNMLKSIVATGVEVPEGACKVHGITTEKADRLGFDHEDVLFAFAPFVSMSDAFLGHNLTYDINIMRHAYYLEQFDGEPFEGKPVFDTMRLATDIVKVPKAKGKGWKWPKLTEAYKFFKLWELDKYAKTLSDFQPPCAELQKYFYQDPEGYTCLDIDYAGNIIDTEMENAHDALADVDMSIEVFLSYCRYTGNILKL